MNAKQMHHLHFLEKQLLLYFRRSARVLPWRKPHASAYEVWVSEIMLQQTQVSRVVKYYNRFMKRFPTVEVLANTSWDAFLPYYAGLGYYARGRNMLKTAQQVVNEFGGVFPRTEEELRTLPGIGPYTARAILSFSYNQNTLAFDTNMQKVFGRYLFGSKRAVVPHEKIAPLLTKKKRTLNAALMDFANDICVTRPRCEVCPLAKHCEYKKTEGIREHRAKVKIDFPTARASVILWLHHNHAEYYSSDLDGFKPFFLPKNVNTREKIKSYFQEKYRLTLSVRPPHQKLFWKNKPYLMVNAQILLGNPEFAIFSRDSARTYQQQFGETL